MDDPDVKAFSERISSRRSLSAECFEWLKRKIYTGFFPAGEYIRERRVEELLGVSRSPIREAFVRLSEFGLGEYVPNRGFRVFTFDARRVEEIGQVRLALENLSVELATEKATEEDITRLGLMLEKSERRIAAREDEYPLELDIHAALLSIADNRALADMLDRIDATVRAIRTWSGRRQERPPKALDEHQAIYRGVAARDKEAAVRAMTRHIQRSTDTMLECVRQGECSDASGLQEPGA